MHTNGGVVIVEHVERRGRGDFESKHLSSCVGVVYIRQVETNKRTTFPRKLRLHRKRLGSGSAYGTLVRTLFVQDRALLCGGWRMVLHTILRRG